MKKILALLFLLIGTYMSAQVGGLATNIRYGTSLPVTCQTKGNVFILNGTTPRLFIAVNTSPCTWQQQGMNFLNTWSSSPSYMVGDVVIYSGAAYVSIKNGSNQTPPSASLYWAAITQFGAGGVVNQIANYSTSLTDQGKFVTMNCSFCSLLLANTPPSIRWWLTVQNLHSTNMTITLAGAGPPNPVIFGQTTIAQNQWAYIFTDGSNYWVLNTSTISGASVSINGSSISNPNINSITPAAPGSNRNATVSMTGSNVSISVPIFNGSGIGHASGLVPDPGSSSGTSKFLREDGTFNVPSGSKYTNTFTSQTTLTISAVTHGLGVGPFNVVFFDTSRNKVEPGTLTTDVSGNITATFAISQSGSYIIE